MTTFEALYRAEYASVISYIRRLAPSRVSEDVAAEAFTALWQTLETGNVEHPKGLLYRIAEGLARNAHRKAQREEPVDHRVEPGLIFRPAPRRPLFARQFNDALVSLADDEFDAYVLTELRGLTTREAADVLNTSQPTIYRRAETARQLIRKGLT